MEITIVVLVIAIIYLISALQTKSDELKRAKNLMNASFGIGSHNPITSQFLYYAYCYKLERAKNVELITAFRTYVYDIYSDKIKPKMYVNLAILLTDYADREKIKFNPLDYKTIPENTLKKIHEQESDIKEFIRKCKDLI